jgi:LacI family transcriptional regulator
VVDQCQSQGRERRATMRDVARRADVSVMTVSRVVNETPNVDGATRERVRTAIRELDYRPNAAASSLRRIGAAVGAVGLVVDDVGNPFCSAIAAGVERVCQKRGTLLLSGSSGGDPDVERQLISAFLSHRVDGLLVMSSDTDHGYLEVELRRGLHVIFVDRSPNGLAAQTVSSDNHELGRQATAHLLAHGHRRIAFIIPRTAVQTARQRHQGYRAAMSEAGLEPEAGLDRIEVDVEGLGDSPAAELAMGDLLDRPNRPTAVVAAQNRVARGVLKALHDRNLQHTVAMVAVDDLELAALLDPPVTVLAQDPVEIGAQAATRLFEQLAGVRAGFDARTTPDGRQVVPARLIVRGSGELPPR